jgi:hypothetical protein
MSILERLDQRNHDIHKRYDELVATNRAKLERIKQLEEQIQLLKQEENLMKAVEKDSDTGKVTIGITKPDLCSHARKLKLLKTSLTRP